MSDRTQSAAQQNNRRKDDVAVLVGHFEAQRERFTKMLPHHVSIENFKAAFITAVSKSAQLLDAERDSLWLALLQCAGDGLIPDGRDAALVIFGADEEDADGNVVQSKANRKKQVVYMPMVRGLRKLVRNTGDVASIEAELVYRGETVEMWMEDGKRHFKHIRNTSPDAHDGPGDIVGAYAIVTHKDGTWQAEWMSRNQIERVRAVSRAKRNGPWNAWYDEMARKTVTRRLIKQLDTSPDLRRLETALDRDAGLEIDGEVDAIREAITKPAAPQPRAQPKEEPQQFREQQPRPVQDVTEEPETGNPTPNASPSGSSEPEPTETQSEAGSPAEFSAFPIDEHGEPIGEETNDPVAFANWFYNAMQDSKNPDALREHNMDAIGDASANPKARAILETATLAAKPPAPDSKLFVPLPRTASGAANLPQYINDCRGVLATLKTAEAIDEWVSANRATYAGKAFETPVIRILQEFRDRFLQAENAPTADEFRAALKSAKSTEDVRLARVKYGKWIESLKNTNAGLYAELMRDSEMRVAELI